MRRTTRPDTMQRQDAPGQHEGRRPELLANHRRSPEVPVQLGARLAVAAWGVLPMGQRQPQGAP